MYNVIVDANLITSVIEFNSPAGDGFDYFAAVTHLTSRGLHLCLDHASEKLL